MPWTSFECLIDVQIMSCIQGESFHATFQCFKKNFKYISEPLRSGTKNFCTWGRLRKPFNDHYFHYIEITQLIFIANRQNCFCMMGLHNGRYWVYPTIQSTFPTKLHFKPLLSSALFLTPLKISENHRFSNA